MSIYQSNQGYVIQPDGSRIRQWWYPSLKVIKTQGIQMTNADPTDPRIFTPDNVHASVKQAIADGNVMWVGDAEEPEFKSNPIESPKFAVAGLQHCLDLISIARQVSGTMPIGFYGDFPANIYSGDGVGNIRAMSAQDSLAHTVDFLCVRAYVSPDTYSFSAWQDGLTKTVMAFQRWASKPLLIYLWDRVQQSPDTYGQEARLGTNDQISRIKYAKTLGNVCLWVNNMMDLRNKNRPLAGYAIPHDDSIMAGVNDWLAANP